MCAWRVYREVHEIVVGEGLALVGVGLAIGLAVSTAAMRPLAGLLHGVPPTERGNLWWGVGDSRGSRVPCESHPGAARGEGWIR